MGRGLAGAERRGSEGRMGRGGTWSAGERGDGARRPHEGRRAREVHEVREARGACGARGVRGACGTRGARGARGACGPRGANCTSLGFRYLEAILPVGGGVLI